MFEEFSGHEINLEKVKAMGRKSRLEMDEWLDSIKTEMMLQECLSRLFKTKTALGTAEK